jgi:hypothetical protein
VKKLDYQPFSVGDKVVRSKERTDQVGKVLAICHETNRCQVQWPGINPKSVYPSERPRRTWLKFGYLRKAPTQPGGDTA